MSGRKRQGALGGSLLIALATLGLWGAPAATAMVDADSGASADRSGSSKRGPCDGDIVFGEVISCNVPTAATVRDLTFTAAVGDRVRVRVVATGGTVNPVSSIRRGAATVCPVTFSRRVHV